MSAATLLTLITAVNDGIMVANAAMPLINQMLANGANLDTPVSDADVEAARQRSTDSGAALDAAIERAR